MVGYPSMYVLKPVGGLNNIQEGAHHILQRYKMGTELLQLAVQKGSYIFSASADFQVPWIFLNINQLSISQQTNISFCFQK